MLSTTHDLLHTDFEQVRATARLLKSLALGTDKLYTEMQPLREQQDPLQRSDRLTRGPSVISHWISYPKVKNAKAAKTLQPIKQP